MRVYDKNMQKRQNSLLLLLLREKENNNKKMCLSGDENTAKRPAANNLVNAKLAYVTTGCIYRLTKDGEALARSIREDFGDHKLRVEG